MNMPDSSRVDVIDSHTGGEPTRCVLSGGPELGDGPLSERVEVMRHHFDLFRRAVLCEPRGSDVLVGALLVTPVDPASAAAVIFFNNAGYLGMCGHGMIGVVATLSHMGRLGPGQHRIETPVGNVHVTLVDSGEITVSNVDAYRFRSNVAVDVPGHGVVLGDIAWGGNWFFLIEDHPYSLRLDHVDELAAFTWEVRRSLAKQGITGEMGCEIDHIELCTAAHDPANHGRNFVLCPGNAYDRSPCGTGTSAKMACLADSGKLAPGQEWRQEGILGTVFTGRIQREGDRILPFITGTAYVTAIATLMFQSQDPFRNGIPSPFEMRS